MLWQAGIGRASGTHDAAHWSCTSLVPCMRAAALPEHDARKDGTTAIEGHGYGVNMRRMRCMRPGWMRIGLSRKSVTTFREGLFRSKRINMFLSRALPALYRGIVDCRAGGLRPAPHLLPVAPYDAHDAQVRLDVEVLVTHAPVAAPAHVLGIPVAHAAKARHERLRGGIRNWSADRLARLRRLGRAGDSQVGSHAVMAVADAPVAAPAHVPGFPAAYLAQHRLVRTTVNSHESAICDCQQTPCATGLLAQLGRRQYGTGHKVLRAPLAVYAQRH